MSPQLIIFKTKQDFVFIQNVVMGAAISGVIALQIEIKHIR